MHKCPSSSYSPPLLSFKSAGVLGPNWLHDRSQNGAQLNPQTKRDTKKQRAGGGGGGKPSSEPSVCTDWTMAFGPYAPTSAQLCEVGPPSDGGSSKGLPVGREVGFLCVSWTTKSGFSWQTASGSWIITVETKVAKGAFLGQKILKSGDVVVAVPEVG